MKQEAQNREKDRAINAHKLSAALEYIVRAKNEKLNETLIRPSTFRMFQINSLFDILRSNIAKELRFMDQKKTGAFIAQCRKEKSLTQMQLAELLDITNQAVSKWENGKGMPDVSLLQPLCDVLGISLNELFSGEHISAEEYRGKAEENISKLFKEKQIANLKPVKYLFSICANVTLLVAVIELAAGLIGNFFDSTILEVMLLNASVWLILFLISEGKLTYDKKKLKNLKHSGTCIDSEIKDIIPAAWIKVGNYTSCRSVCEFIYEGKEYKAVSSYYVLTPFLRKEDLYANVYIDKDNPAKYSVELFQASL